MPVEDRRDLLLRRRGLLGKSVELALETSGAIVQHLDDQFVLAGKMAIHRHLGHIGLGNDPVDAGGMEADALEQGIGGFDDVLAFVGGGGRRVMASISDETGLSHSVASRCSSIMQDPGLECRASAVRDGGRLSAQRSSSRPSERSECEPGPIGHDIVERGSVCSAMGRTQ